MLHVCYTMSAASFLAHFPGRHTFQTKCDVPDAPEELQRRLTHVIHGDHEALRIKLETLNELGAGVYFSVHETDGTGRKAENIVALRALVVEFDHGIPETPNTAPPSLVVASSQGKSQWYWLLETPLPATPENVAEWKALEAGMCASLGGDKQATLVTQVLRVPGYFNAKYSMPFKVELTDVSDTPRRYTMAELAEVWTPLREAGAKSVPAISQNLTADNALPPLELRQRRYLAWLNALPPPVAGRGERNGWYYAKAAKGLRDFALEDAGWLADTLADHSAKHHGSNAYDHDAIRRLIRNASRSATGVHGGSLTKPSIKPVL